MKMDSLIYPQKFKDWTYAFETYLISFVSLFAPPIGGRLYEIQIVFPLRKELNLPPLEGIFNVSSLSELLLQIHIRWNSPTINPLAYYYFSCNRNPKPIGPVNDDTTRKVISNIFYFWRKMNGISIINPKTQRFVFLTHKEVKNIPN